MTFKSYESKPVTRTAHEITITDTIEQIDESTSTLSSEGIPRLFFKHYEPVSVGDFVVFLSNTDIYHCTREVFSERNII